MNITRKQHYVWRHYLTAWAPNGKIAVLREKQRQFEANPKDIAAKRDFYRIPAISENDENFLRRFIDHNWPGEVENKSAQEWLSAYSNPSQTRRQLVRINMDESEIDEIITPIEIELEEKLHSTIENNAINMLNNLRQGDGKFWQNDECAIEFAFFISMQHMRTKKVQDDVINAFEKNEMRELAKRIWPVLRIILVTKLGWSFYSERSDWNVRCLNCDEKSEFITSDQPIINLLSGKSHYDLAFYYPVAPYKAMLFEHRQNEPMFNGKNLLNPDQVEELNQKMADKSHEQLFATSKDILAKYKTS